jgi:outer membrane protein W
MPKNSFLVEIQMRTTIRVFSFVALVLLVSVSTARAQGSWSEISVSAARVDFDLSGTGETNGLAVRATRPFTPHVVLELRSLFARPCQQFQDCKDVGPATLFAPEAQLQYHWTLGRMEPYVGAGLGISALRSSLQTDWDPTMSFAVGTGVRLTDQLGLTGEVRLRGHEWRFVGSTAEISTGVVWRLPQF